MDQVHNRNAMGVGMYIFESVWWLIIAMAGYRSVGFRHITGLGLALSKLLLWIIAIICVAVGVALTLKKRRTALNVIATISIPFGIYSLISCGVLLKGAIIVIGFVCLAVLAIYFTLVMWGVGAPQNRRKHLLFFFLGARIIVALALLAVVAIVYVSSLFGVPLLKASKLATVPSGNETEWSVEDHIEKLRILGDAELWSEAGIQERLDALQIIANIEVSRLGIGHELYVGVDVLGEHTAGSYSNRDFQIVIDAVHIRDEAPLEVLDTLCHEAYHAYEYRLADLYTVIPPEYHSLAAAVRFGGYYQEFNDYTKGEENDFYQYYMQTVEIDARNHSKVAAKNYIEDIRYFAKD